MQSTITEAVACRLLVVGLRQFPELIGERGRDVRSSVAMMRSVDLKFFLIVGV
jgi:flagellar biosynthesis/type III secretory pathway ATPase